MKFPFLLVFALLIVSVPLPAQIGDDTDTAPPPGSTVIRSDELHSDQNSHTSVFTGNVIVDGTNFHMTCHEMTVIFTTDNKVDHIVAVGDVVITQPDRVTNCGHAEYWHDSDTFILTDQPVILDHKNKVAGPKIIINRQTQKMTVEGGRSTVTLPDQNLGSSTNAASATLPTDAK